MKAKMKIAGAAATMHRNEAETSALKPVCPSHRTYSLHTSSFALTDPGICFPNRAFMHCEGWSNCLLGPSNLTRGQALRRSITGLLDLKSEPCTGRRSSHQGLGCQTGQSTCWACCGVRGSALPLGGVTFPVPPEAGPEQLIKHSATTTGSHSPQGHYRFLQYGS